MADNHELRHLPGQGHAIARLGTRSVLIARGRADAARLGGPKADVRLSESEINLVQGLTYRDGKYVPQDLGLAAIYFRKAADQGQVDAQYYLGWMYFAGEGVRRDYAQAFHWLKKAADQDHSEAQCEVGALYADGVGVPQDYEEAYFWLRVGIRGQNKANQETYAGLLEDFAKNLSPARMTEVQRRLKVWLAAHQPG